MSLHDVFQSEAICLPSKLDTSGHMIRLQVKKDKLQCKARALRACDPAFRPDSRQVYGSALMIIAAG